MVIEKEFHNNLNAQKTEITSKANTVEGRRQYNSSLLESKSQTSDFKQMAASLVDEELSLIEVEEDTSKRTLKDEIRFGFSAKELLARLSPRLMSRGCLAMIFSFAWEFNDTMAVIS